MPKGLTLIFSTFCPLPVSPLPLISLSTLLRREASGQPNVEFFLTRIEVTTLSLVSRGET